MSLFTLIINHSHDVSSMTNFAVAFVWQVLLFDIYGGPIHFWNIAARCNLERFIGCWDMMVVALSLTSTPRLIFHGLMSWLYSVSPLIAKSASIFPMTGTNFIPHPPVKRTMRLLLRASGRKSKTKPTPSSSLSLDSAKPARHVECSSAIYWGLREGNDFFTKPLVKLRAS